MKEGVVMTEHDGRGLPGSVGHTRTVEEEVAGHGRNNADEILAG